MPKLLLVTSGLGLGGAETLLIDLALLARARGWSVEIRSLIPGGHHRETLTRLGFDVADFGMRRGASDAIALARSVVRVRASDANIVQCWMYHANLVGGLASLGRRRRSLFLGIFSAMMNFSKYNPLTRAAFKAGALVSQYAAGVVYNGRRAATDHEASGYRADRTIVIANSVDFERFRPDPVRRAAIRRELGLSEAARVVVAPARNDPQKDWPAMLDAARRLPDMVLLATGLGTETLDAPRNVLKLGPRRDIEAIYAASDAFMLLSNFGEGTSVAMCEAMATGLPVVTTDVGDNAPMLGDAAGVVVPISDANAAARALAHTLERPERRQAMASAARERVQALCRPEAAFAPLWTAYERALDCGASRSP